MSLRRADHSSRGVLPTVLRRCVWSRNIKNRRSIYIYIYIYIYASAAPFICLSHNSQQPQGLCKPETVHNKVCPCMHWFRKRTFWAFAMNCDLINNKNSTVIKFGTCNANVWRQPEVKYHVVKVFTVARNLKFNFKKKNPTRSWKYVYMKLFLCFDA